MREHCILRGKGVAGGRMQNNYNGFILLWHCLIEMSIAWKHNWLQA